MSSRSNAILLSKRQSAELRPGTGWVARAAVKGTERAGSGVGGTGFAAAAGGLETEGGLDVLWLFLRDHAAASHGGSKMKSRECWSTWGRAGVAEWFCVGGWRDGEAETGSTSAGAVASREGGTEEGNAVHLWDGGAGRGLW